MRTVPGRSDSVVVVGAGLGGLAAAIRLAAAGREVTVLERAAVPGGRAGIWRHDGYTFDTGPTVLTMPNLIEELFELLGESMSDWLTLNPLEPLYRSYFPDGSRLDVHTDPERMHAEIADAIGPAEADNYLRFVEFVTELYRLEIGDFIDRNIDTPLDLLTPNLLRLIRVGGFRRLAPKVHDYLKDPRTQRVFSFQAMYAGLSPFDALAIYAVISYMDSVAGVYFPAGGVHSVPAALAAVAGKHGVRFEYDCEVSVIERNGLRAHAALTKDGRRFAADAFVLNPDLPIAYRELLGFEPWNVRRLKYSPSCALLLLGSTAGYSQIAHHNIHFGRAWRGVFDELIARGELMSDPSFFVTNPSRSDPSLAPAGRQSYYVLFPTPNNQAPIDYGRYRDTMLATMESNGYRDISGSIEVERFTTPADWEAMGLAAGAPFAASHSFFQTGPFRPRNTWGDNVVFTGSGTTPGVGVPMVLLSGKLAAQRITG